MQTESTASETSQPMNTYTVTFFKSGFKATGTKTTVDASNRYEASKKGARKLGTKMVNVAVYPVMFTA